MPHTKPADILPPIALVRIETLIRLRWLAILGQTLTILFVAFALEFPLPWVLCLSLVALSALLNVILAGRFKSNHRLESGRMFALLAFDILQLGLLLYLTGGLQNPFAVLLMAPVIVSATSLPMRHILLLGSFAAVVTTALIYLHHPLPWFAGHELKMPRVYVTGMWVAIVSTLGFTAVYTFRVAEEARRLAQALAATELVLQREQHLTALDGLAAAAAHELGTPLATIALVSKEMVHALPEDSPLREDARLLRAQAARCREILQKLTSLSSENEGIMETLSLNALVEEAVTPLRELGVGVTVERRGDGSPPPKLNRNPAILYGLGNLIDNAADFSKEQVRVIMDWDEDSVSVAIEDDGPGFDGELFPRLGEPFVTTRPARSDDGEQGLGLGVFIAKTLLDRSGADVDFANLHDAHGKVCGARVGVRWPRHAIDLRFQEPANKAD